MNKKNIERISEKTFLTLEDNIRRLSKKTFSNIEDIPLFNKDKPLIDQPYFSHIKSNARFVSVVNHNKEVVGISLPEYLDIYNNKIYDMRLKNNLELIMKRINFINGDIVELGVFKGRNTKVFGSYLYQNKINKYYHGFDTFSGYTREDIDNQPSNANLKGILENNKNNKWNYDYKILMQDLEESRLSNVCKIYVGDLKENLKLKIQNKGIKKISLLYVDCNAYLPAYVGMTLAYEIMDPGSMIFIDEHQRGGETFAIEKFATEKNLKIHNTGIDHYKSGPSKYVIKGVTL